MSKRDRYMKRVREAASQRYKADTYKAKISDRALSLIDEWSKIAGNDVGSLSKYDQRKSARDYVLRNLDTSDIKTGFFMSFILPWIIKQIVTWLLEYLMEQEQ